MSEPIAKWCPWCPGVVVETERNRLHTEPVCQAFNDRRPPATLPESPDTGYRFKRPGEP